MKNKMPLSIIIENVRADLFNEYNRVASQSGLPAYLMEEIVVEILSEIRKQKNIDMIIEMNKATVEDEKAKDD